MSRLVKMLGTLQVVKYIWDQIIAVYSKLFVNSTPRTVILIRLKYLNFSQNSWRVKPRFRRFLQCSNIPEIFTNPNNGILLLDFPRYSNIK